MLKFAVRVPEPTAHGANPLTVNMFQHCFQPVTPLDLYVIAFF